jgi:hypothetical protein
MAFSNSSKIIYPFFFCASSPPQESFYLNLIRYNRIQKPNSKIKFLQILPQNPRRTNQQQKIFMIFHHHNLYPQIPFLLTLILICSNYNYLWIMKYCRCFYYIFIDFFYHLTYIIIQFLYYYIFYHYF